MEQNSFTNALPMPMKTLGASAAAAGFRIFLTPIDTIKTTMQVEGANGIPILKQKYATHGLPVFWYGALATAAATFAGHYPWFATSNTLDQYVPQYKETHKKLMRNAGIGFCASVTSDTISNSLRVVKTFRQTSEVKVSYAECVRLIVEKDGYVGLFGRGLKTRLATNGMQGMMFSVVWKMLSERFNG